MREQDYKPNEQDDREDELDRVLNSALAMFATVEARAGLEDRILANLRAEESAEHRSWWAWGFAAAVLALVIVVVGWRSNRQARDPVAKQVTPAAEVKPVESGNLQIPVIRKPVRIRTVKPPKHQVAPENPKLDQFPSPQPLSEQEKILAMYISKDPERAALIAEARMEDIQQAEAEKIRAVSADDGGMGR